MTLMTATMILLADIFMMGDSTMCDYKPGSYPQEGWGQRLRTFVKPGVTVHNRAVGGSPLSSWAPAAKDIKMKGSFKVYNAMPESLAADVVPDLTFTQHYGF